MPTPIIVYFKRWAFCLTSVFCKHGWHFSWHFYRCCTHIIPPHHPSLGLCFMASLLPRLVPFPNTHCRYLPFLHLLFLCITLNTFSVSCNIRYILHENKHMFMKDLVSRKSHFGCYRKKRLDYIPVWVVGLFAHISVTVASIFMKFAIYMLHFLLNDLLAFIAEKER